jgi:hypothetical protein
MWHGSKNKFDKFEKHKVNFNYKQLSIYSSASSAK